MRCQTLERGRLERVLGREAEVPFELELRLERDEPPLERDARDVAPLPLLAREPLPLARDVLPPARDARDELPVEREPLALERDELDAPDAARVRVPPARVPEVERDRLVVRRRAVAR
jgi:hypothetical protein